MHEFLVKFVTVYKKHPILYTILALFITGITAFVILIPLFIFMVYVSIYYLVYLFKTLAYYKTPDFLSIKEKLAEKIVEYNEFDHFMDETRDYIRSKQQELTTGNVRNSTLTVYKNSQLDVYKYIVKYFFKNTKIDESSMQIIEAILQKYNTINQTHEILTDEYNELMEYVQKHMYRGAYIFKSMTMKKLGSRKLPKFEKNYYMWYAFNYTSPTNRKSYSNSIVLNEERLEDFAEFLNNLIAYRKSAKFQRQLMTPRLRESILVRDKHTCRSCDISTQKEAHLLLEVDHIIPIAKGGITIETNLQTLCWKCNRTKGAKVLTEAMPVPA
jgi:hypothetical protein